MCFTSRLKDIRWYFGINVRLSYHILSHHQTVILARKWLNAEVRCCLLEANRLSDILFYFERGPDFPPHFLKYVLERSSAECALTIKWSPHEYSLQSALNLTVIKKVRYIHILAYSMCANGQSQLYICITVPSVVDFSQVMSGVSRTRMILISVSSSLNMWADQSPGV